MLPTGLVVTANVAVVAFAATVTLAATVAIEVLLLLSATAAPPDGAGPTSVTVPVDALPPVTLAGFTVSELTPGGATVIVTVAVLDVRPPTLS